ncbi:MAG: hypothetical protein AMXMBFR84_12170 [Candidatus Hydrogenedentota bacterium]
MGDDSGIGSIVDGFVSDLLALVLAFLQQIFAALSEIFGGLGSGEEEEES